MSETIPLSSVEASAGFWELADPAKRLKDSIHKALRNGSLELWLMGTRPPTPEECRVGYQFLEAGTDDMPVADTLRWHINDDNPYAYNLPVQIVHCIKPEHWVPLSSTAPGLTEADDTLLSLVPASVTQGGAAQNTIGRDNRGVRYSGGIQSDDKKPMRIRWALLRSGGGMGPHEITWGTTSNRGSDREVFGSADFQSGPIIFDFRDGIPLTVGPRDSNANVRLGDIHRWVPRADVFSIHVPLPITPQR